MRLICPNCSAQYEIDATMIPVEGRDVQCSNCGHTWFELHPAAEATESVTPETASYDAPEPEPDEDLAEEEPQSNAVKAIAAATEDVAEDAADDDAQDASEIEETKRPETEPFKDVEDPFDAVASEFIPGANSKTDSNETADSKDGDDLTDSELAAIAPTTLKARRPSDAADLDVLREEADLELSRRAPPSEALESQTDLGLEDLTNRKTPSRALRARMARSSGANTSYDDPSTVSDADYKEPQRDLLPDIDEINSTLNQSQTPDPAQIASSRSGFRFGFGLTVLICIAAILAYAFAPTIANAVPGAENALLRFVDLANQLRDWIDGLLA